MGKVNYFKRWQFRVNSDNFVFSEKHGGLTQLHPETKCQWDISRSYEFIWIKHQFTKMD